MNTYKQHCCYPLPSALLNKIILQFKKQQIFVYASQFNFFQYLTPHKINFF